MNLKSLSLCLAVLPFILVGCLNSKNELQTDSSPMGSDPNPEISHSDDLTPPDAIQLPEAMADAAQAPTEEEVMELTYDLDPTDEILPLSSPPEGILLTQKTGSSGKIDCTNGFNDSFSLQAMPDYAWDSFGFRPFYSQWCTDSWIKSKPLKYSHYHLGYEHPMLCGNFDVPKKYVGVWSRLPTVDVSDNCNWDIGTCIATGANASYYPRNLNPHDYTETVKFYVRDMEGGERVFDLVSIKVLPNQRAACYPDEGKIQVWIKKKATGQWRYWRSLSAGTTWYFPQSGVGGGQDLSQMRIKSPGKYGWTVDDVRFKIHPRVNP